jgi:dienelactone hydrolase
VAAVAGTYAATDDPDVEEAGLLRATRTAELGDVPLLPVWPEHDLEWIATANTELLDRCASRGRAVDLIEVPGAHHGFETVDDTGAAREAIGRSIAWWGDTLGSLGRSPLLAKAPHRLVRALRWQNESVGSGRGRAS